MCANVCSPMKMFKGSSLFFNFFICALQNFTVLHLLNDTCFLLMWCSKRILFDIYCLILLYCLLLMFEEDPLWHSLFNFIHRIFFICALQNFTVLYQLNDTCFLLMWCSKRILFDIYCLILLYWLLLMFEEDPLWHSLCYMC